MDRPRQPRPPLPAPARQPLRIGGYFGSYRNHTDPKMLGPAGTAAIPGHTASSNTTTSPQPASSGSAKNRTRIPWPLLGCVEGTLRAHSRENRIARTRERNEERASLRVDLMAAVLAESAAEKITAEAECVCVVGAERPDGGRRRLDIADEERDRSGRQVSHRTDMIAPGRYRLNFLKPPKRLGARLPPPEPVRGDVRTDEIVPN